MEDPEAGVDRQAGQAERGEAEHRQPVTDDIDGALDQAVADAQSHIPPGQPIIDAAAEILGHHDVEVHKYAVQITVADVRDGACSSSTLKEACSWGKVDVTWEQMVFAEATSVLPLLASDAYHHGHWKTRAKRAFGKMFD